MASILDYAKLSEAVYEDNPQVPGWHRHDFRPSGSGVTDAFQGAAFTRDSEIVFAMKGTSQGRDLAADLALGVGMNSVQFSDAVDWVSATNQAGATLATVCGHSLGGAISQIVGNRLRLRFVTFNAPGIAIMSRNLGQMAVAARTGTMFVRMAGTAASAFLHPFQAAGDVGGLFYRVSGVNFRLAGDLVSRTGVHYGQVIEVGYGGGSPDPYTRHKMATILAELEDRGYDNITLADLLN